MENVYLCIRRATTTIFLDLKDTATVMQLKKVLEGIIKKSPDEFSLFLMDTNKLLEEKLTLSANGLNPTNAKAHLPACLKLVYREGDGYEKFDISDYSAPPELPDVMKTHESADVVEQP